jgi:hypothetical protein
MDPIFIHAMWRTGSTYVWKKFRDQPQYRAYYEPLHESLGTARPVGRLLPAALAATRTRGRNRGLRHPDLDRPYLDEYPLRWWAGGVRHFKTKFAQERYWLDPDDVDADLLRYISSLVSFAARKAKRRSSSSIVRFFVRRGSRKIYRPPISCCCAGPSTFGARLPRLATAHFS